MLVSEEVEITVLNNNKKRLRDLGYDVSKDSVNIKIEHLTKGSKCEILVKCNFCNEVFKTKYCYYIKSIKNGNTSCCSKKECTTSKKKNTNLEKFGKEWASQNEKIMSKIKITNLERWGTEYAIHSEEIKNKILNNNLKKWGHDHPMKSEEVKNKIKNTNLERWGTEYVLQNKDIKEKIKETLIQKYGVDNPLKSEEIRDKSLKTKLEKYGDENYNNREKFKITILDRYGVYFTKTDQYINKLRNFSFIKYNVDHPLKSDEIRSKIKKTKLDKYGDENYNNIDKIKETSIIRWGVDSVLKNKEIREKIKETNFKKYGFYSNLSIPEIVDKRKKIFQENNNRETIEKYRNIIGDEYTIMKYEYSMFCISHIDHEFQISTKNLYDRVKISKHCEICTICNPINSNSSSYENEIIDWLESLQVKYFNKDRKILKNKELDIYLPEYNLAIEFNGLFWHSDRFKDMWYHREKTDECISKNIDLIHIYEDDWIYKKDIVKSIIKNRINKNKNKIYARQCEVLEIDKFECEKFLKDNHIQGYARSKYKFGLYYRGELVSVMTFGYRRTNSKKEFELIRFCNKIENSVLGAASKLLNHFIKHNHYKGKIISYADISMFNGGLYEKLGFKFIHKTRPNYYWIVGDKRFHRFKFNKKNLINKFKSDPSKTENEIMKEMGNSKIWSCGQIRYEIIID